jgi:hypothetical protein
MISILKSLFRKLDDYYKEILLKGVDTSIIEVDSIGIAIIFLLILTDFSD